MNAILQKFEERADAAHTLVCVGLDSDFNRIPERFRRAVHPQFEFNKWVIDETCAYAAAFKPNMAFYEARGIEGLNDLQLTIDYLRAICPEIVTICDAKRADIGNTNQGYVEAVFDRLGFDAITLHPYLGSEALTPFLERRDKACIVLCKTSNPGSGELQDLQVDGEPLWHVVARKVSREWNEHGNCMLVVGATYPEEMRKIREVAPEITLLVPGIGEQGGEVAPVVSAGMDSNGRGLILSSSRGIIFNDDPGAAARELRDAINAARGAMHAAD